MPTVSRNAIHMNKSLYRHQYSFKKLNERLIVFLHNYDQFLVNIYKIDCSKFACRKALSKIGRHNLLDDCRLAGSFSRLIIQGYILIHSGVYINPFRHLFSPGPISEDYFFSLFLNSQFHIFQTPKFLPVWTNNFSFLFPISCFPPLFSIFPVFLFPLFLPWSFFQSKLFTFTLKASVNGEISKAWFAIDIYYSKFVLVHSQPIMTRFVLHIPNYMWSV